MRWARKLEYLLLLLGALALSVYVAARIDRILALRAALETMKAQEARSWNRSESAEQSGAMDLATTGPDFRLWSPKRIRDYKDSLTSHFAPAIAILRIPKLRLEVPLLDGTDDLSLNRGVGLIEGTAKPGEGGNVGIAGHRDGFFRGLKDVAPGDTIEVVTRTRTMIYRVDHVVIVSPEDVSVLAPREKPSLTLVTCYPFYFIGSAPKRYIVQAFMEHSDQVPTQAIGRSRFQRQRCAATRNSFGTRKVWDCNDDSEI